MNYSTEKYGTTLKKPKTIDGIVVPECMNFQAPGGIGLGIDATFCGIIGLNVHFGIYRDNDANWSLYGGINFCAGVEAGMGIEALKVPNGQTISGENQNFNLGLSASYSYNALSGTTSFGPSLCGFKAGGTIQVGQTWSTPSLHLF